jgi:hypothetical protein
MICPKYNGLSYLKEIEVEIFQVTTLCSVAVGCQCFREPCSLHLQGEVNGTGKGA